MIRIEDISPKMDFMKISETNSDNSKMSKLKILSINFFKALRIFDNHTRKKKGWITNDYYWRLEEIFGKYPGHHSKIIKTLTYPLLLIADSRGRSTTLEKKNTRKWFSS